MNFLIYKYHLAFVQSISYNVVFVNLKIHIIIDKKCEKKLHPCRKSRGKNMHKENKSRDKNLQEIKNIEHYLLFMTMFI